MRAILLSLLLSGLILSCRSTNGHADKIEPVVPADRIMKDMVSFLYYQRDYLRLHGKFTAVDTSFAPIDRAAFFQAIRSGDYLPLRLKTTDSAVSYQLCVVPASANASAKQVLLQTGAQLYVDYAREGKKFPAMDFTDLTGKHYDSLTLAGKTVVLKCWFVHCVACVDEMPRLNQLVADNKNRKDIVFLSLASDTPQQLSAFLKKKQFDYAVIPVTQQFFNDTLQVTSYPTHMIIRDGIIQKAAGNAEDLIDALNDYEDNLQH
ncbi:TlpA family protein disulfide reductase [Chitinophaga varians]|uniref:TlpA family protein disulfide reductase n=1 Tax=Chitinophaga varians TaxID=2202339 RepID=UPI00165EF92D|nr:TlpA disulfide reductase family protein [Chitinophaga varians]MBC9914856.1 TlpA family protein disulfide reductase [Chitinophaga varians]